MNVFPNSPEGWNQLFQILAIVFVAGTVGTGLGIYFTGKIINKQQAERILNLEKEVAEARTKQAEAEERLEYIKRRQEPRRLNFDAFVNALRNKPKAVVRIVYQPDDPEAYGFAFELYSALGGEAKWNVMLPRQISQDDIRGDLQNASDSILKMMPSTVRVGGQPLGISIVANNLNESVGPLSGRTTALRALAEAFLASGFGVGCGFDKNLPDNFLILVVGPKP